MQETVQIEHVLKEFQRHIALLERDVEILKNRLFWSSIESQLATRLHARVTAQVDVTKRFIQFWISGLPTSIQYRYSHDDSNLFFSALCLSPYLAQKYEKELVALAEKFAVQPRFSETGFEVRKKLEIADFTTEASQLVSSTIEILSSLDDDRNSLKIEKGEKTQINYVFENIYNEGLWFKGTSGSGSNPAILKGYIVFLNKFIQEHGIRSICDIGCGDWQYMKYVLLDGIQYTGYDVSSKVIEDNRKHYASSNVAFEYYNGDFSKLRSADLAICKDVLQHLPNENIRQFLEHAQNFRYVLVANDYSDSLTENKDIIMGQCRPLDLRLAPFFAQASPVYTIIRSNQQRDPIQVFLMKNSL